jgi:hypothetical protein
VLSVSVILIMSLSPLVGARVLSSPCVTTVSQVA